MLARGLPGLYETTRMGPVSKRLVAIDGVPRVTELVRGAGAQADRTLYVYRELSVGPGDHELAITFVREGNRSEAEEPEDHHSAATDPDDEIDDGVTPVALEFRTRITPGPKQVALVTYDVERRQLVLKGYGTASRHRTEE